MTHPAYEIIGAKRPGRWLITCDHASNHIPNSVGLGSLGISAADMSRHIAYDPGAAGLATALSEQLNSPAILSQFSRLVIDPNRGEDDPTLIMQLYDGTIIPANRNIDPTETQRRLNNFHRPYHAALAQLAASRSDTVILAINSFTPCLRGRAPRPWHLGILYGTDARLSRALLDLLQNEPDLCTGDNQPYRGQLPNDAIDRHAISANRHNTLIELRNDLITTPTDQTLWATRLAPLLTQALHQAEHLEQEP